MKSVLSLALTFFLDKKDEWGKKSNVSKILTMEKLTQVLSLRAAKFQNIFNSAAFLAPILSDRG